AQVTVAVDQRTVEVNEAFVVGGQTQTLQLPAGPYVEVSATGIVLTLAGQRITGDLTVRNASGVTTIRFAKLAMSFGAGDRPVVRVSNGNGLFTVSGKGVVGTLAVTVALDVPGVLLSGTFALDLDTTGL